MKKTSRTFLLLITIVALVFGWMLISTPGTPQNQPKENVDQYLYYSESPTIGSENSNIKIVVFSDYLCPYCEEAHNEVEDIINSNPGSVEVFYRNLIVHPEAEVFTRAALAASYQGKFKEMNNALFANDPEATEEAVISLAQDFGLDVDQFKEDLNSEKTTHIITTDEQDAVSLGIRGTPALYVNGQEIQDYRTLQSKVDEMLK